MANDKKKKFKHVSRKGTLYQARQNLRRKSIIDRKKALLRINPKHHFHKGTDTEKRVANFAYLLGFGFFFMIYVYTSFKTKVIKRRSRSRENFRNADRSLFVVKTRCCPALKYYSGWMSLFSMVMMLLFFIFQAAAEIDLCWDDSKDIYRGTEKRQISQRAYLDFLRKSAYGFVILLAAQLCVWDTTPEKKDQDGDGVEEKTLELENINGSRRRQARRARQRKRRLKRQKDRFKSMRNLRINWYNMFAVCVLYVNLRIVVIVAKIVQRLLKDSRCNMSSDHGANSVSMDYCLGFFFLMIFLRFIIKARNFNSSIYNSSSYSFSSFLWRIFAGCKFDTVQERNLIVTYMFLAVFNGILFTRVLTTGINSLRQIFYGILIGLFGQWPFINYLDTVIPEGLEMNMPGRATPSEITPISYFGRRRYRLFTLLGIYSLLHFTALGAARRYTSTYIQSTVAYNIYWVLLDIFSWVMLVYILLNKMTAPRQGFVSYESVMPSEGRFHA